MMDDKELYQQLGRMESKLDSITETLTVTMKRLANLEVETVRSKEIQARHGVIIYAVSAIATALAINLITKVFS